MANELKPGQVWRHLKRGDVYHIVATGAKIQCSTYPMAEDVLGDLPWVIYTNGTGFYFRLESEFLDGRFELIDMDY